MRQSWTVEQVLTLAPDTASARAGRGLAAPARWSGTGLAGDAELLWGACQGSGATPYQAAVDLSGPAYRCSCPSRKFPCKHALGLLLLWAAGQVEPGQPPGWAASWRDGHRQRAERGAARAESGLADPDSARRRAADRAERVTAGLDELARWLADQVRTGVSERGAAGHRHVDGMAARMVDAQAPGVAATLRRLDGVTARGADWPGRLVEEYGLLHLLVAGHRRLDLLPAPLAATVRTRVGYPVGREEVLAEPAVRDTWAVLGLRDTTEDRLRTRRVWLRGATTGRFALVLSFATAGGALDATLVPGTALDADLHFYPGGAPLRALVGARHAEPAPLAALAGGVGLVTALAAHAAALAADPWVDRWPVVLADAVPVPDGDAWLLGDPAGDALGLVATGERLWRVLAVSGGHPVTLAAEYTPAGLVPLSVTHQGGVVPL